MRLTGITLCFALYVSMRLRFNLQHIDLFLQLVSSSCIVVPLRLILKRSDAFNVCDFQNLIT